ncbi:M20 family metallopeptidase [Arthrobacter crystallopoietes]|uniref:M20 family metallopeptidase n=1 Tax=Crystallibacter crystallopoietes TaxID=37928 RepID=UPI0011115043|nr:M20 family metallopeptidase [Arthrobacter crystallopoietes]
MSTVDTLKQRAEAALEAGLDRIVDFSHRLHGTPEVGLEEVKASAWLVAELEALDQARIEHGLGELPTAVRAEAGHGELVLTICAEYDALPGIGHACGHNIIAAAALGAFTALAPLADELGVTVRLLGTPAEETAGGKIIMLQQGDFDGTHAAMMVHPNAHDESAMRPYACSGYRATFRGRSAHASAAPHEGINALDALTVALAAIGLARQQLKPNQQIHGYVLNAGSAPNVIPDKATGEWMVRADSMESLDQVTNVLHRCLEAGGVASGCQLEIDQTGHSFANLKTDGPMADLYNANARALGRSPREEALLAGSTDMGNVSQYFPSIHPMIGLGDDCPPIHSAEFADFAISRAGDQAVRDGALGMAWTCIDLATDQAQRHRLLAGGG